LKPQTASGNSREEYARAVASGKYVQENCYLSPSGASILVEKGHNVHIEEIEAAKALADYGYPVILTSENDIRLATNKDRKGNPKFSEGKVSVEMLTFEQSTPSKIASRGAAISIHKALEHAKAKGASVAVVYDRSRLFHRNDIDNGIKEYESHRTNTHRFKSIIIIDGDGGVHEWTHNK